jgi:esterase/lipase superfamily enzyme
VFVAPDHDAARFADTLVPALRGARIDCVLYTSRRDRALTISRRMHDTPRAGLAEPAPLVRDGLETVDVTDAFAADGWCSDSSATAIPSAARRDCSGTSRIVVGRYRTAPVATRSAWAPRYEPARGICVRCPPRYSTR